MRTSIFLGLCFVAHAIDPMVEGNAVAAMFLVSFVLFDIADAFKK